MKITLIGFMGVGKSTVAKVLSQKLQIPYVEMDELIIKKSNKKSINEIFKHHGELEFRELEIEVSKDLKNSSNIIISSGGGVVMNKINIDYLKHNGLVIQLDGNFETIVKRIGNVEDRPLFKNKQSAKSLYNFRKSLYARYADHSISTDNLTVDEVVTHLIKTINEYLSKN